MSSNNLSKKRYLSLKLQLIIVIFALFFVLNFFFIVILYQIHDVTEALPWFLIFNAILNVVVAVAVALWVSRPIETLRDMLHIAYTQGIPYKDLNNNKFSELNEVSEIVTEIVDKYINAIDEHNAILQQISHELKTPLAAVRSTADLIKYNGNPNLEDYKHFFQVTQYMNQRMITLVNELTTSNKSYSELVDTEVVNFTQLIEDVIKAHELLASERDIKILTTLLPNIYKKGSSKYLSVALSNVLENAIKYSQKPNSKITVSLEHGRNDKVLIIIRDNGIGISSSDLRNIFTRFYRGENIGDIEGTGLGLFIAKRIISAHRGSIKIKSKLNQGTEVIISL